MKFSTQFIGTGGKACSFAHHVNAPYLRRSFTLSATPDRAHIRICGLGFYELYVNGRQITKGALAPYISNPDDIVYYDDYDVTPHLTEGENVVGVLLGNGFQNPFGGAIWDFEQAKWLAAPKLALYFEAQAGGETVCFEADESFKTSDSPITFDEYRMGTYYDARLEQPGWCSAGFDDSGWQAARLVEQPRGQAALCRAEPIAVTHELSPVSIAKVADGYLYDFGANLAGVCRLTIAGERGQCVRMQHAELLHEDGSLDISSIIFAREGFEFYPEYAQKDSYTLKGEGTETFVPSFTYHGFRYVYVTGITEQQATRELLTYLVMNSDLAEVGGFSCSEHVVNQLQLFARRSDLANFYYFPTDCPHREKNGWTGDASMSSEHMLLNLDAARSLRQWLDNIRRAQREDGALPGIIPTGGWGFAWGNGPAWDSVLFYLPYYIYKYTGDESVITENAAAMMRYLHYITTRLNARGLIAIGLGDWLQPDHSEHSYSSPLEFTDSAMVLDMAAKASFLFGQVGMKLQKTFADELHKLLLQNIRTYLIDTERCMAVGDCQTSQVLGIAFDIFTEQEKQKAFSNLLELIHSGGDFMDVGMIGARYLFHVLSDFGETDLALKMITRPERPSYGEWVARGATALWEDFNRPEEKQNSKNHHFFGDISSWFIQYLAGIRPNPNADDIDSVLIAPCFAEKLTEAHAYHIAPAGKIEVTWKRTDDMISLHVTKPEAMHGTIELPFGYQFEVGGRKMVLESGVFAICRA